MGDSSRSDEDQSRTHNVGAISCSAYSVSLGTLFPQKLVARPKERMPRLDEWLIIALSNINSKDKSMGRS